MYQQETIDYCAFGRNSIFSNSTNSTLKKVSTYSVNCIEHLEVLTFGLRSKITKLDLGTSPGFSWRAFVDFSPEATRENHVLFHEKNIDLNLLRGHIGLESWNNQTKIVWVPGARYTKQPTIHWNLEQPSIGTRYLFMESKTVPVFFSNNQLKT